MIIRSQDKKSITTDLDLHIKKLNTEKKERIDIFNRNGCLLGTYSTEEKAIKVLDMIQSAYNTIETMKIDKQAWRDNHYFEMPQDSEV